MNMSQFSSSLCTEKHQHLLQNHLLKNILIDQIWWKNIHVIHRTKYTLIAAYSDNHSVDSRFSVADFAAHRSTRDRFPARCVSDVDSLPRGNWFGGDGSKSCGKQLVHQSSRSKNRRLKKTILSTGKRSSHQLLAVSNCCLSLSSKFSCGTQK